MSKGANNDFYNLDCTHISFLRCHPICFLQSKREKFRASRLPRAAVKSVHAQTLGITECLHDEQHQLTKRDYSRSPNGNDFDTNLPAKLMSQCSIGAGKDCTLRNSTSCFTKQDKGSNKLQIMQVI